MSLKLMKEHTFPKNISIFLSYFTGHTFAQKKSSLLLRLINKHIFAKKIFFFVRTDKQTQIYPTKQFFSFVKTI